jgi:DNA-damage-inducible protein J
VAKSAMVRARVRAELKRRAERVFSRLGLSTTQAITIFYRQVEVRNGLPFDVVLPNPTTRKTLEDTDAGKNLVICQNAEDMFKKLGI